MHTQSIWLLLLAVAFSLQAPLRAEDETSKEPENLRELIDQSLDWFQVYPSPEAKEPCKTITALRWANNSRGSEDGITLLYVSGGKPYAAACVYPWAKRLEHDFQSLSRGPLVARRDGGTVWNPKEPGVTFADIPDAPAPEASPTGRLRQLKSLTERFSAVMLGWKSDNSDREELRLLPRPLYRYETKKDEATLDGAVFAFAMGTDPEVLLLLEAVKVDEKYRWQYAFARRTSGELEGRLDGKAVWNAGRFPTQRDPARTHFTQGTLVDPRYFEPASSP
jgi:hypothetical protein